MADTDETSPGIFGTSYAAQIERLQQRQLALVQETAVELELLKQHLAHAQQVEDSLRQEREPLFTEVTQLRQTVSVLEGEREQLRLTIQRLQDEYRQYALSVEGTFEALRDIAVPPQQSSAALPLPAESVAPKTVAPAPAHKPLRQPVLRRAFALFRFHRSTDATNTSTVKKQHPARVEKAAPVRSEPQPEKRTLIWRIAPAFLLVLLAYGGYAGLRYSQRQTAATIAAHLAAQRSEGQVAGVSSDPAVTQTGDAMAATSGDSAEFSTYAESFADLPYDQTIWESFSDSEFKLRIEYPKNTSNRVRIVGGNNLWFLRKLGYLLKVTVYESDLSLDSWWEQEKDQYADCTATKTTFKGEVAWHLEPLERTDTAGQRYFLARPNGIMEIWLKDEPPATDDGKRITRMVESLTFLGGTAGATGTAVSPSPSPTPTTSTSSSANTSSVKGTGSSVSGTSSTSSTKRP